MLWICISDFTCLLALLFIFLLSAEGFNFNRLLIMYTILSTCIHIITIVQPKVTATLFDLVQEHIAGFTPGLLHLAWRLPSLCQLAIIKLSDARICSTHTYYTLYSLKILLLSPSWRNRDLAAYNRQYSPKSLVVYRIGWRKCIYVAMTTYSIQLEYRYIIYSLTTQILDRATLDLQVDNAMTRGSIDYRLSYELLF